MPDAQSLGAKGPNPIARPVLAGLLAVCAAATGLFAIYRTPYGIDDAWITYRYAENLADGLGFVYNAGERVLGTSTPLYTLLLAGVRLVGLSVPVVSQVIGWASMLGAIVATFILGRRLHSDLAGLVAATLLASMQIFHRVATYGMETPLYVCLIASAFAAYASERRHLAIVAAAGCALLRLDGLAVGASLVATDFLSRRRIPWRMGALYAALIAPWFAFSLIYFGSVFPNSFIAKQAHTHHALLTWMPEWLLSQPHTALAAFGAIVCLSQPRTRPAALAPVLWSVAYVSAYLLSSLQGYEWYRTPMSLPLAAFAAVGTIHALGSLLDRRWTAVATGALLAVLIAPDAGKLAFWLAGDRGILRAEAVRYEAAMWLQSQLPRQSVLVSGGIGHVGYFTRNYILDAMGLVSPQVVNTEGVLDDPSAVPFPRFLPFIVERYQPEYVFDGFWLPAGRSVPDFMERDYALVRSWDVGGPAFPRFLLMKRRPPPTGSGAPQ